MPACGWGWAGRRQPVASRLLVTGANGQLGRELLRRGAARGFTTVGQARAELDITDQDAVERAIDAAHADLVVNAAAYTAVDQAESEPDRAYAVNAEGTRLLARACAARGLPMIHVSTDYVFDGAKAQGYVEDDPVGPLSVYGASKEAGERALREELAGHVILRTAWVYSAHSRNFVLTMLQLAAKQDVLRVVGDQHGSPTAAGDLADAILTVAGRLDGTPGQHGTFHFAGSGVTSWAGFAQAVMALCLPPGRPPPAIVPIATAEFPRPARRPASSLLLCGKIGRIYQIEPRPWREALAEVGREILAGA
jgi:dTDP-4-dehydrorhamnose reductase